MEYPGCRPVGTAIPAVRPERETASPGGIGQATASSGRVVVSEPVPPSPPPSLAFLIDQARAAQAELAGQPLPITNHHHRFLMNLFGG